MARKKLMPGRMIALSFASVILLGTLLLLLPVSRNRGAGVSVIDALFTSTSAVCVTGLGTVDTADTFSVFGRVVVALLIQVGGLGVASIGVGFIIFSGKKIGMRERLLAKEGLNYQSFRGVLRLVKSVLTTTVAFETIGMALSFLSFRRQFPFWKALGVSAFHAVSAFNNAGFDILGGFRGLIDYRGDVLLNLTTCALIICGGLGFYVIHEIAEKRSLRACSLHTKIVLTMTAALLLLGTLLLRSTERITWLGAFFHSTSARTAGFATYPLGTFTNAGLLALIVLMFIGASPGSTGGGIKTTTFYVLLHAVYASATNQKSSAFHRNIPRDVIHKAFVIAFLAVCLVTASTFALCVLEKDKTLLQLLFEVVSAFGTVGLSTGITPDLLPASKAVLVLTMYIGRLGPLTAASLWLFKPDSVVSYPEESVTIG